jgi:hypothetical protein
MIKEAISWRRRPQSIKGTQFFTLLLNQMLVFKKVLSIIHFLTKMIDEFIFLHSRG